MSRRSLVLLLSLGAIWGASFMLLKIALRDLPPTTIIGFRIASAALTLALLVPFASGSGALLAHVRRRWLGLGFLGLVNTAAPFLLLTWGQQYVASSVAAIFNASAPIWTAVLALFFVQSERLTPTRLAGVAVGFGGVALLVGLEPSGTERAVVGSLAIVAAALLYAVGTLYAARRLADVPPMAIALGSLLWATAMTLPLGLARLPGHAVTPSAAASVLALGVVATGVAYVLYFALVRSAGASHAVLVSYLVPSLAFLYGATLLGEAITAPAVAGLLLVLLGVALGTGALRRGREVAAPHA